MKRIVVFVFLFVIFGSQAFAEGMGMLTLELPEGSNIIFIDNKEYVPENNIFNVQLPEGRHSIKVIQSDEDTSVSYDNLNITANNATLIRVPLKEKGVGMGFAFGLGGSTYTPSTLGDPTTATYTESPQYDLSWFYCGRLKKHIYFDIDICLHKTASTIQTDEGTIRKIAVFPVRVGLKGKINNDLMIGTGLNYSFWIFNENSGRTHSFTYPGGPGFQIYVEYLPFSTEFGYMTNNAQVWRDQAISNYSTGGLYVKYKLYI